MQRDRDASGRQQVNQEKFPLGWPDVTAFIHGLGMKSGLYSSKSYYTCAGFNASCMKETIDAATYAEWGIDYLKVRWFVGARHTSVLPRTHTSLTPAAPHASPPRPVQEDSCGSCRNNDTLDYVSMHQAIQAAGRPMVQTDEGAPDNYNCSTYGGCGNAKRVGHDISPSYLSMQSLVDMASGLWVYAHNASVNPESGGWWK